MKRKGEKWNPAYVKTTLYCFQIRNTMIREKYTKTFFNLRELKNKIDAQELNER